MNKCSSIPAWRFPRVSDVTDTAGYYVHSGVVAAVLKNLLSCKDWYMIFQVHPRNANICFWLLLTSTVLYSLIGFTLYLIQLYLHASFKLKPN
jgi:hypothetical protein